MLLTYLPSFPMVISSGGLHNLNIRFVLISGLKFFEKLLMGTSLFVCFKADVLSSFPMYLYIPAAVKLVINVNSVSNFCSGVKVCNCTVS